MNQANPVSHETQSSLKVVRLNPIIGMIALTTKGGIELVNEDDIVYCKANGGSTLFYFNDGRELMVSKLLKKVLESLSEDNFHRIHNSYIVNMNYAIRFHKKSHGGDLELNEGKRLPVSEKNKNYVLGLFKIV